MKILYIDLSNGFESLSVIQNEYGGAGIPFVYARERFDCFYTAGHFNCFRDIEPNEKHSRIISLGANQIKEIINGSFLGDYIENYDTYDLVIHNNFSIRLNTGNTKQACLVLGHVEQINPLNDILIMHNPDYQRSIIQNENTKIFKFQLGRKIPDKFIKYKKSDFLFQCTNQSPALYSKQLAAICRINKIKCIFAGPIHGGYKFLNEIDNVYTFYIGIVPHLIKNEYLKLAIGHSLIYSININNLSYSGIDALGYGCPIITNGAGFLSNVIKDRYNGIIIKDWNEFPAAYAQLKEIEQQNCYLTASNFSIDKTISEIYNVCEEIIKL